MKNILIKILNFPTIFQIKIYPYINRMILKSNGVLLGRNVQILGKLYVTIRGGKVSIGDNFYFLSGEAVNPISSNLRGAIYVENGAIQKIGNNVGMSGTRLWVHDSVTVGNNVKIGGGVLIIDTDVHPMDFLKRRTTGKGTKSAPIVIEDDVWIGAHSIILKGVTIGARSIVGTGSIVTKSIPADIVAAGNPCKVLYNI